MPRDADQQDGDSALSGPQDRAVEQRRAQYFKSRLCHAFMRGAPCSYGDRCQYAHGHDELRLPHREGLRGMPGPGFHPGMMVCSCSALGLGLHIHLAYAVNVCDALCHSCQLVAAVSKLSLLCIQ